MRWHTMLLTALTVLATAHGTCAKEDFSLTGGETIVFFGDSITQAGLYAQYIEAFLATRFPDKSFRVINRGISSETISGTSEADHRPRRPNAHDRFARDVAGSAPNVLVACFGMNDGNYHPFDPDRFEKYQAGIQLLIDRTREQARARLVLLTPPPFDPYRRQVGDPGALAFGYKFPAVDYDETLERYSQWLLTLRDRGIAVADVHTAMNDHLRQRRAKAASFFLQPDGVHPNPTGHWLMAQTLLLSWNAPAVVAEVKLDAAKQQAQSGDITDWRQNGNSLSFTWRTPLPMPSDPQWDPESIALEKVNERLNRHRLAITGLPAARYRLAANAKTVADVSRADLERGLDLVSLPNFPTNERSRWVFTLIQERSNLLYDAWRKEISLARPAENPKIVNEIADARRRAAEIDSKLHELCQPMEIQIELTALDKK